METLSGYVKRAPLFNQTETSFLMDQVVVHKRILLNKSTKGPVVNRKKRVWRKIEKAFTEQARSQKAFNYRSDDVLKNRWDNLKRIASKHANSLADLDCDEKRATLARVIAILSESDKISAESLPPDSADDDCSNDKEEKSHWEDSLEGGEDKQSTESMDDDVVDDSIQTRKINRSINFSPEESRLLLQCVRPEKKYILSNNITAKANLLKHEAWDRVTAVYNKKSLVKRSHLTLKTKLENMKRMAKRRSFKDLMKDFGNKHQKLVNENTLPHKIKVEPISKDRDSTELTDDGYNDTTADIPIDDDPIEPINQVPVNVDPLSTVLNGNVGNFWSQPENNEVVKLQMELLNSQIETAKLERQRVMNKMQAEATERQSRELETSLRLRAARLEAVVAEMKLPPNHPALHYTPGEQKGQHYINGGSR